MSNCKDEDLPKYNWLLTLRRDLTQKKWELEFDSRLYRRDLIADINAMTFFNGQKVKMTDYVLAMENDLRLIDKRLKLADEYLAEMEKENSAVLEKK